MTRLLHLLAALLLLLPVLGCEDAGGFIGGTPPADDDDAGPGDDDDAADDDDTGPVDQDGDGFDEDEDCDDDDPTAYPGGDEGDVADGADNDCNGWVDDKPVCEGVDGAYGTIQEGIDDIADGWTLLVCPGTYPEHLEVSGRDLAIVGAEGPDATIVDGEQAAEVLKVTGGSTLQVVGLTLTSGAGVLGGAVVCSGSDLALEGSVVTASFATSGAGLYADDCDVALTEDLFTDNLAELSGGGVYLRDCSGTVSGSRFEANVAFEGGGLYAFDGAMTIYGNSFVGNEASTTDETTHGAGSGGGGVWLRGSPQFTDNAVQDNVSHYNGGGVFILQGNGLVADNTVTGNHCDEDGGGVYTNHSYTLFTRNTVVGNSASDDAGGLRVYIGWMDIIDNHFELNTAGDDGGAMKMSHSSNRVEGCWFEGNVSGDAGGGLELDNETANVTGCTFIDNTASRGGGMHSWRNEGQFEISDSRFEGNVATNCGGGLAFDNDPYLITVSGLELVGNHAMDGGAVCLTEAQLEDESYLASNILFRNLLLVDNTADDDGGAFYIKRGHAQIRFTTIHDNAAGTAGGLAIKPLGSADVNNSILSGNDGDTFVVLEGDGQIEFGWNAFWDNDGTFVGTDDPVDVGGNVAAEPGYVDAPGGDFHLAPGSDCIDAGDPDLSDVDGTRADLGAYGGPHGS